LDEKIFKASEVQTMDQLWYEDNQREGEEDLKYEEPQVEFVEATCSVVQKIPLGITKCRKRITQNHEIAQIGFGGCGGMYNYFLGVASVLQVLCNISI
jgi:S-adenosylmethionine synthetase